MNFVDMAHVNGVERADDWPEPTPLPDLPPVPEWNDALLPEAIRPWLSDAAERTQCPPEYPAVGAMVALASVIGRGCAIRPKRCDDWTVVPNLYGAIVGPPSAMKTPALSEAIRPLRWLAQQASEEHTRKAYEREALDARRQAFRSEMQKAAKSGGDLEALRHEYEEIESEVRDAAAERRYLVYDATVEKLGELLRDSPRGLLLMRDELVGWLRSLDKIGHENDRAFFLEAWNGTGSYVYDRIARGTVVIPSACVSIVGGIQPGPLGAYLRAAVDGGMGDDGLMQRLQLLVYPDPPRHWTNVDRWPDSDARQRARNLYVRLANARPEDLGAQVDTDDEQAIPYVRFAPDAQEVFDGWRHELENRVRSGAEHPVIEAHLVKYRSLLPSLALVCHLADVGAGAVGRAATIRAAAWCDLLEAHMRRVYATVSAAEVSGAKALLSKIRAGRLSSPFVARDVYLSGWAGLSEPEAVKAAVDKLAEYGWTRRVTVATGGRPRDEVHVHPSIRRAA